MNFEKFKFLLYQSQYKGYIYRQPVVYTESAFFLFGGYGSSTLSVIARLDARSYEWSQVGSLNSGRYYHNVIVINGHFLVIGGDGEFKTEKCLMASGSMSCSEQSPTLDNFNRWPELFAVESSYCQEFP